MNAQTSQGNTPLMYAASGSTASHEAVVRLLLEHGANVSDCNENGHTPLMEAASAGNVSIARILVEHGASINTHSNEFKESALTLACYKGHLEMVRFLLEAGADQEHKTEEMHTALMEASMDGHVEVARLLLDSGAQVNMPADSFESPLTLAACGGHTELAMLLLERGANIEEVNDEGYTPLMEAAREGHEDMVALLLSQGADINAQTDETQETALTLACCGGFLDVADFLIKAGADIEAGANTPLAEAAQEGHLDLVKHLIAAGANVNATSATGDTPLMYACENGHTDVMEVLLEAGANLEQEAEGGRTPLMKACRAGHLCAVQYLVSKGANVNKVTTNNDHTPLSLACAGGHMNIVEFLLAHGSDPQHRLKDNSTMLIEAAKGGHTQVVQLLIGHRPQAVPSIASATVATAADSGTCGSSQLPSSSSCSSDPRSSCSTISSNSSSNASSTKICAPSTTSSTSDTTVSRTGGAQPEVTSTSAVTRKATATTTTSAPAVSSKTPSKATPATPSGSCSASSSRKGSTSSTGRIEDVSLPPTAAGRVAESVGQTVTSTVMQSVVGGMVAGAGQEYPPQMVTNSTSSDADLTRRETERLEECVNNMMKRTEMLNPSREEQIIQKQQILEELQRVERELHFKTRNSQRPPLSQAIADIDTEVSSIVSNSFIAMRMFDNSVDGQPNSASGSPSSNKCDATTNEASDVKTLPNLPLGESTPGSTPATKRVTVKAKKKSTSTVPASNQAPSTCAPSKQQQQTQQPQLQPQPQQQQQQQQISPASLETEVEKLNLKSASVSDVQVPETDSQTQSTNPNDIQVVQQLFQKHWNLIGTRVEEMATELRPYFEDAVASGIFSEDLTKSSAQPASPSSSDEKEATSLQTTFDPTKGSVPGSLSPSTSMPPLPPLTSQQISQLRQQFVAAAGGQSSIEASRTTLKKRPLDVSEAPEHATSPSSTLTTRQMSSRTRPSTSSTPGTCGDHPHQLQLPRRAKIAATAASSVASQTVVDSNVLDGYQKQNTAVKLPPLPGTSKTATTVSTTPQVPSSCPVSSTGTTGPSIPSPPSLPFNRDIEIDGQTDSNHDTALTFSCAGGHEELVLLLLSRGANFEHRDKKGFTPLMIAATTGHACVCEILLNHGADIEAQSDRTKDTALSLACSSGRYEVVELLLNRGANKEHRNVSDYTPLSLAASGGYVTIIKLLLNHGAEINSRTGSKLGISPLMLAAMNGHASTVKLLLDMGSDINAQIETNRNTALTLACFQGRCEVVSLLLDRKANVEHRAKTGLTPLMEAASGGYVEVGRILLDKGADVNAPPVPSSRDTALTIAADKGHFRFVELLIKRGGPNLNLDARNKKGSSPLWLAANGGHLDVVQLLVSSGADIDAQDNRKVSCLMSAFRKGHLKVVKWMVKHVTQFPSDAEMARYLALVNDDELQKKCNSCLEVIRLAKEKQAAEANKNATILLEELDKEKMLIEKKKETAAKKREKKKQKKKDKKEKAKTTKPESTSSKKDSNQSKSNVVSVAAVAVSDDDISEDEEYSDDEDSLNVPAPDSTEIQVVPTVPVPVTTGSLAVQNGNKKGSNASIGSNYSPSNSSRHQSPIKETSVNVTAPSNKSRKNDAHVPEIKSAKTTTTNTTSTVTATQQVESQVNSTAKNAKNAGVTNKENVTFDATQNSPESKCNKGTKATIVAGATKQKQVSVNALVKNQETMAIRSKKESSVESSHSPSQDFQHIGTFNFNGSDLSQQSASTKTKKQTSSPVSNVNSVKPTGKEHPQPQGAPSNLLHDQQDHEWTEVSRKQRRISVPSTAISRVIGRAGCNINAVREYSGAHIEVEKQKTQQADRLIIIRGSAEATKTAQLMINALVNEPDTDLMQIVAKLGLDEPGASERIEDFACTNLRGKSGSVSKPAPTNKPSVPTGTVIFPQSTSTTGSPTTVTTTTTVSSKISTVTTTTSARTTTPSAPFASTWQPTTALKSPATVRSASVNSPVKPIAVTAVQGGDGSCKSFSPVTSSSSRPSSQPYPPNSPGSFSPAPQQATANTGEYTPFTNSLFGKVGWGGASKDHKLNFATVAARGSSAYPLGNTASTSPSTSLTSALTINPGSSSASLVDSSPPLVVAEPSKAPGFRGTFVSPPSSNSASNSSNTATLRTTSPSSPQSVSTSPSVAQQQQEQPPPPPPSLLTNAPIQSAVNHSPSIKPFNLAPGSRTNVTNVSSAKSECISDLTSPISEQYRSQSIDSVPVSVSVSSVQSSLNPNAQTYAPDSLVTSPSLNARAVTSNSSVVFQSTKQPQQPMASTNRNPVAFEQQIPNPQLAMQMRAAILAAGASLQMQTLQAQQAAAAHQQHQKAMLHQSNAHFSMGQPDFPPPTPETLRLLQTALMTSAAPPVPLSQMSNPSQVTPIGPPPPPPAPIGSRVTSVSTSGSLVTRKVAESSISSTVATTVPSESSTSGVIAMESEKSFPRPIGTERAQKKHPPTHILPPFGGGQSSNLQPQPPPNELWPLDMNTIPPGIQPSESDWLNQPFSHPATDALVPNLLQSSIASRSFETAMVEPALDQTFQVLSHEPHTGYADANGSFQGYSSGNATGIMPFINGGLIPSHHHATAPPSSAPMSSQLHHQYMQGPANAAASSQGPPNTTGNEIDYLTHFGLGSSNWRN